MESAMMQEGGNGTQGDSSDCRKAWVGNGFSVAVAGDLIGPFRPELPLQHPAFLDAVRILQKADVAIANQECTLLDLAKFSGYRAAENGGGYPVFPSVIAADLKAMGFDVVTKANNHATDFGAEGLLENLRILERAGVAGAGAGASRAAARAPAVHETPRGRVAVIACATTFTPMSEAGDAHGEIAPRPGINVVHVREITLLPPEAFAVIEQAARLQGCGTSIESRAQGSAGEIRLGSETFRMAEAHGLTYEAHPADVADLLREVRQASQVYDFVVLAMHAHESRSGDGTDPLPGDFLPQLYHAAVEAGANLVMTTGPHLLRGIEIHRGCPIFYGLGSFFLQMEGGLPTSAEQARAMRIDLYQHTKAEVSRMMFNLPDDWFDSVIARSVFEEGRLARIELHPVKLEQHAGVRIQGAPRYATGADAARILERLADMSSVYGTDIRMVSGLGVIECRRL